MFPRHILFLSAPPLNTQTKASEGRRRWSREARQELEVSKRHHAFNFVWSVTSDCIFINTSCVFPKTFSCVHNRRWKTGLVWSGNTQCHPFLLQTVALFTKAEFLTNITKKRDHFYILMENRVVHLYCRFSTSHEQWAYEQCLAWPQLLLVCALQIVHLPAQLHVFIGAGLHPVAREENCGLLTGLLHLQQLLHTVIKLKAHKMISLRVCS